jgi:hypothetical protein
MFRKEMFEYLSSLADPGRNHHAQLLIPPLTSQVMADLYGVDLQTLQESYALTRNTESEMMSDQGPSPSSSASMSRGLASAAPASAMTTQTPVGVKRSPGKSMTGEGYVFSPSTCLLCMLIKILISSCRRRLRFAVGNGSEVAEVLQSTDGPPSGAAGVRGQQLSGLQLTAPPAVATAAAATAAATSAAVLTVTAAVETTRMNSMRGMGVEVEAAQTLMSMSATPVVATAAMAAVEGAPAAVAEGAEECSLKGDSAAAETAAGSEEESTRQNDSSTPTQLTQLASAEHIRGKRNRDQEDGPTASEMGPSEETLVKTRYYFQTSPCLVCMLISIIFRPENLTIL